MASANPPSDTPAQPPRPTGDLEHLFRQRLAGAEVRPRANFWDQLDHELVAQQHAEMLRQNLIYRRRAAVYRGAAAASLVLALGLGSWAYLNQTGPATNPALTSATGPASSLGLTLPETAANRFGGLAGLPATLGNGQLAAALADQSYAAALANQSAAGYGEPAGSRTGTSEAFWSAYQPALLALPGGRGRALAWGSGTSGGADAFSDELLRAELGLGRPGQRAPLPAAVLAAPTVTAGLPSATPEYSPKAPGKLWRRLHLGGSYALSVFNPNINFSRADARTQTDPVTDALRSYYQDDAEREYRRNLRSGPSQRVALTASYQLGQHWTVGTGLEWAESRASSATSFGFLDGKQVGSEAPDLFEQPAARTSNATFGVSNALAPPARATSYRYRTAAVPVSVQYGSHKAGLSLYAKAGAVVSLLINSRSELEGSPDAARSYDIRSAESPYRTLFASGRAGGGVRYQPTHASWNLTVGSSAEVFITPLNANPSQRAARQTRPYSLGVEASLEFGGGKVMPGVQ